MSKFKNFCKKPVTWGGYFKLCGICYVISVILSLGYWAWLSRSQLVFRFGKKEDNND